MERTELMQKIVATLDNKKATNIKSLEITELSSVADYFVIATGTSGTHIRALSDEVQDTLTKQGVEPRNVEGKSTGWILLEYQGVVVHIFLEETRNYYNLERLWEDGTKIDISDMID